ncbi:MAG: HlyD family secretion protein [Vibrio sp.]
MTPDQQFTRLVKVVSLIFVFCFLYFLFADLKLPMTTQSMATRMVTKVAPRVSGRVVAVHVQNNQQVKQGDVLFEIDDSTYQLAVEEAQLNLEMAQQVNDKLDASIAAAKAQVSAYLAQSQQKYREAQRMDTLYSKRGVSKQQKDAADSAAQTAHANVLAAKADLHALEVSRGEKGENNLSLRQAKNQLKQAKLNLAFTQVKASTDGMVSNLQLEQGGYASAGQASLALIDNQMEVIADFREKALRDIHTGHKAYVAFDGDPGALYAAKVTSIDAGVSTGQFDANGVLATPQSSDRWVRDAQRLRIHFALEDSEVKPLASGARATVQLVPDNPVLAFFARVQIRLVSILHYIY